MVTLVTVQVALIWSVPVLPCQDLAQHLAGAHILRELKDGRPPFGQLYQARPGLQSYFTSVYLLVALERWTTVETAARLVYSAYVVAMALSFASLLRALGGQRGGIAASVCLLVALGIWNPVACMGFLGFTLALPLVLGAFARFVDLVEGRRRRRSAAAFAILSVAACSLHLFAGVVLAFVVTAYVCARPGIDRKRMLAAGAGTVLVASLAWLALGDAGLLRGHPGPHPVDPIWYGPATKLGYTLWAALGPWDAGGLVLAGLVMAGLLAVLRLERRPPEGARPDRLAARRTALCLAALGWLLPWGIFAPSELTFIDLRVLTVCALIALACLQPLLSASPRARKATVIASLVLVTNGAVRIIGFGREVGPPLRLLARAASARTLLPLVFDGHSRHFGRIFRLSHFLALHYTLRSEGITTQFWAGYTEHLPVMLRPGAELPRTPADWNPSRLAPGDLQGVDYVLLQRPPRNDQRESAARRVEKMVQARAVSASCDGVWCLYDLRALASPGAELHDPAGASVGGVALARGRDPVDEPVAGEDLQGHRRRPPQAVPAKDDGGRRPLDHPGEKARR
jgi:hypothetical protein